MDSLTIGKLAEASGVGIDTVRFYERTGLIRKPARSAAGYRLYAAAEISRLRFIRRAKGLGFSLEEIAELLRLNDGQGPRASVRELARRRLDEIERKLRELQALQHSLQGLVQHCDGEGGLVGCPIIEAVLEPSAVAHHPLSVRSAA